MASGAASSGVPEPAVVPGRPPDARPNPVLAASHWIGRRIPRWVRRALPVLALATAYAVALRLVPPTTPIPLVDDWVYRLSVDHLVDQHRLWIAPPTVVTLVLQVVWGSLFSVPFGVGPVALRCSTLVASFGGTLACYGLFRELGATRLRATIGGLAVWFNPLTFVLPYTFMSDVPYLALLSAATWAAIRGARRGALSWWAAGSALAGLAFLVRQQGALFPLAAVGWLLLARPGWVRAAPVRALVATVGPCAIAVAGYAGWASAVGLSAKQLEFLGAVRQAGPGGALDLTWHLAVVGLFYVGLFVLPLVLGAVRELPTAWRQVGSGARVLTVATLTVAVLWTNWSVLNRDGRTFPFIPYASVIHEDGLGPVDDVVGWRSTFFTPWVWAALGLLFALAAAGAVLLVAARAGRHKTLVSAAAAGLVATPASLLLALGLGQFAGMVPPSLPIAQLIAYDRYYLPLLPCALGLALWAGQDLAFSPELALVALAVVGTVDVLGLQDWLAFKHACWDAADWLVAEREVSPRQIDGGLQWDAAHFYEYGLAHPDDRAARHSGDPWWLDLFAPAIDPVYIVTSLPDPRDGYHVYARRPYTSWIRPAPDSWVYVWVRDG